MSLSQIDIRHAQLSDAEALSAFIDALADEGLDTVSGSRFTSEEERNFIKAKTVAGQAFLLLAFRDANLIGMLELTRGSRPFNSHAGCMAMSVVKTDRRRGVGTRLIEAARAEVAHWDGFCRIELEVVPWNIAAIRLYEKTGFVREGIKRKAINLRGTPEELVSMALVWD